MHQSEIDRQAITQAQADQLYHLLCELFPGKAADLQGTMNALDADGDAPDEIVGHLMGSAQDWFHYGN
jgi:hypothetical protein